jgi:hypothetical protein
MNLSKVLLFGAVAIAPALMVARSAQADVTYVYTGLPLTSEAGTVLQGDAVYFQFSTPNPLPADLSEVPTNLLPPASSVPVLSWSVSVGPYQASGSCLGVGVNVVGTTFVAEPCNNSYFVLFDMDAAGTIDGWIFEVNPVTTDGENLINVSSESPSTITTIFTTGTVAEYVQINPNIYGTSYTEAAVAVDPGSWTEEVEEVPEPVSLSLLSAGIVALGMVRRRKLPQA